MQDTAFQKLLDDLAVANYKYKKLLAKAEEEYKRRYGSYPPEIDDDQWIDTFHVGCGKMTVEACKKHAESHL